MRRILPSLVTAGLLLLTPFASAHRLDEYLQVAVVSLDRDHVGLTLFLTPGVAVFGRVVALMDTNHDGVVSREEGRRYVAQVVRDVTLAVDGHVAKLGLVSSSFPTVEAMRKGLGTVELHFTVATSERRGARRVAFENRHQKAIAATMVNCVVPDDPTLTVGAQHRTEDQSRYEVAYRRN